MPSREMRKENLELSLVVPMYNEEEMCGIFFDHVVPLMSSITPHFEIICVNDGSTDRTLERLLAYRLREPRIKVVELSRNFGKEVALTAGLESASGMACVPIDADMQDPPELIVELVAKWREGYEMVVAVRQDRQADSFMKRTTAGAFYRLMKRVGDMPIPPNAGDFRLMDRRVVDALLSLPERNRFLKGLFTWVGFKTAFVPYVRQPRAAGTTKWRYWGLWNFALEGLLSFTTLPLRIWTYIGAVLAIAAFAYLAIIVVRTLIVGVEVPGYSSLISIVLFANGMMMVGLGVMGEYVGRIFIEVKQRPLYLVRARIGFDAPDREAASAGEEGSHRSRQSAL
jgi:glycosyltransferase involved in cell wall biosynthesis